MDAIIRIVTVGEELEERSIFHGSNITVEERTAELEAAQAELVRKERLATLGQLTATVAHELRNPLGTVRGSLFSISERLAEKKEGVKRALERAERNIVRCDNIIEELLDYSREMRLNAQLREIDKWLSEVLDELALPHGATMERRLASGARILIDRDRLRRCVINVVNNAWEAMTGKGAGGAGRGEGTPGEGPWLAVSTRVVRASPETTDSPSPDTPRQRLEIQFIDNGPGIAPDQIDRILEPLYSTKDFGVGLGLPIVQLIMERHEGGIEIESEPARGTTVTLWLPLGREGADPAGSEDWISDT